MVSRTQSRSGQSGSSVYVRDDEVGARKVINNVQFFCLVPGNGARVALLFYNALVIATEPTAWHESYV
ncbi:hypothetical protein CEXT_520841 [Caerostris extrusa]|uniref:Uncharacterized protein n=1 Tax=Caerostris extrusa TaxID=172846 RepID=A0AAV4P0C3_CAEEX|nr:hypothetical protein CEXT_520841 [Caerostris extrusa]